jgi:hypothetical protein
MYMEILEQIIISIEAWNDPVKVGEETRAMRDTIYSKVIKDIDPLHEALLEIIETYEDDYELGKVLRNLYIPIKVTLNDYKKNT